MLFKLEQHNHRKKRKSLTRRSLETGKRRRQKDGCSYKIFEKKVVSSDVSFKANMHRCNIRRDVNTSKL